MNRIIGILAVTFVTIGLSGDTLALAPFKKAFQAKYLDDHKDAKFQSLAKKTGCNVCHVKGAKSKSVNNDYGKILKKLIEGDAKDRLKEAKAKGPAESKAETEKVLQELDAAFEKAANEKSDDGKGPTYGELIKNGKLPVDPEVAAAKYAEEQKKKGTETEVNEG